jgi:hypothetical protein
MKKLFFKNISKFKEDADEAIRTLMYSLLMEPIKPIKESQDKWIECAINQCRDACSSAIFYRGNYNFFGVTGDDIFPAYILEETKEVFNMLGFTYGGEEDDLKKADEFFQNTILMHCIMSSYDTVMQLLSSENEITSYSLINKINDKGYNALIKLGLITKDFKCLRAQEQEIENPSSKASGLKSKIKTHYNVLKKYDFSDSFYYKEKLSSAHSDLFYKLINTDLRDLKNILKLYHNYDTYTKKRIENNWKIAEKFYNNLSPIDWRNPEAINCSSNITDDLYMIYKTENIFGLELASCIAQNISQLKKRGRPYPDGINEIKILALVSRLPNVFSRNLYFQFAVECLWGGREAKGTFFKDILNPESVADQGIASPFNIHDWLIEYKKFSIFLSDFVFPIYEWYFLSILLITASQHNEENQLNILQNLLSEYISKNYTKIIHQNYKNYKFLLPEESYGVKKPFSLKSDTTDYPDIAPILSAFKTATQNIKSPLLNLNRFFCVNPYKNILKYNYIMGEYITSVVEKDAQV